MRDLTDFLPHVRAHAMACPDPVAVKYLRDAAAEWCRRTRVWRETDEFQTLADETEVACVPPYAALHEIEAAWFNGRLLERVRWSVASSPRQDDAGGEPNWISQAGPDRISLVPPAAGTLRINMWLKPAEDADMVPDFLFDHAAREIAWGALAEIKMLPNQPFTEPNMAMDFRARFDRAINSAGAVNIRGQQRAAGRGHANFF